MPQRSAAFWLQVFAAAQATACFGSPTPLAPGLSGSVGTPNQGTLTEAVELRRWGTGFVRYRPWGDAHWGTPELIQLIEEAALKVDAQAPFGFPLVVGDLSAKRGGKIPRHSSHRTGRDVDFLWYVTTPAGAPVRNPGFISVGSDGLALVPGSGEYLRLDVHRQWLLFKALLTSATARVQWLFVSREVEALITEYAMCRGEPLDLIWYAESVMQQPTDGAPHADHVHVRLACSGTQAVSGCLGGGPYWPWLPALPALPPLDAVALTAIGEMDPVPAIWDDFIEAGGS